MVKRLRTALLALTAVLLVTGCAHIDSETTRVAPGPGDLLGNPDYRAVCYGGYREKSRDAVPSVEDITEDLRVMAAAGIRVVRTYNTRQYAHAANLLEAIRRLKQQDPDFEMYVMLGTWIECEGAWTDSINHEAGNVEGNATEINAAVELVNRYPDIVKIIAVGNEAMVQWAASYFVHPKVVLKWVNHLQDLKRDGIIPADVWITSSDNFASWGGGPVNYHTEDLAALVEAVDYVSLHTYPFHDTHYNSSFWLVPEQEAALSSEEQIDAAMRRARDYAISQYQSTADYVASLGFDKPLHIGETGWATTSGSSYGALGSRAADEYKQKLYHDYVREWTDREGISCFYFEMFDEQWKDAGNPDGSENHFGLITLEGEAKPALWDLADSRAFDGLTRGGTSIKKTRGGQMQELIAEVLPPPVVTEAGIFELSTVNRERENGDPVEEGTLVVIHDALVPDGGNDLTYPSARVKLNAWEGTCGFSKSSEGILKIAAGTGSWWGCALEMSAGGAGENLSGFAGGALNFEIKGDPGLAVNIGFQTGLYTAGTQVNNFVAFGPGEDRALTDSWTRHAISVSELNKGADLTDVTGLIYFMGGGNKEETIFEVRNVSYTR